MPQDHAHRPDPTAGEIGQGTGSLPEIRSGGGTYFLGRYRVVDEIGIGGMASVHLGRLDGPGGFQKWVAIKRIHSHLIEDDSFIQMFLDEARVAARISHPNVATVFELGKHEDTYWIAMEYLHGEPLRELMRRTEELGTAMPPEIACRVIADAAEGLHAAHELLGKNGEQLQLVHRDVTPHNLFVTYDGTTKVVDFGIAKFSSRMSNTRAGTLKGKLAYMSPEQVHGEGIDRRTDIFALGVVLWELTTGQRLFRMESDLDTLAKVQECNVPRPSTLIRGYPVDLEKIVMKALAKNRGERFKTAREFSRALQSLLMRRGLFIASDEVAGYIQSIFAERIQKREAHLRWAADVTSTISLEGMLAPTPGMSPRPEFTTSEVQAAQSSSSRQAPRPAAGMPASPAKPSPSNQFAPPSQAYPHPQPPQSYPHPQPPQAYPQPQPPQAFPQAQPPQAYPQPQPPQAFPQAQPPQAYSQPQPPQAFPQVPRPQPPASYDAPPTLGPRGIAAGAPAPAKGALPRPVTQQSIPDLDSWDDDAHPSENDGPTIQASPGFGLQALGAKPAAVPLPSPVGDDDDDAQHDDGPTIMASPQSRGVNLAEAGLSGKQPPSPIGAPSNDDFDDEADGDATIVSANTGQAAPPEYAAPLPAAGRPAAPPRPAPAPPAQSFPKVTNPHFPAPPAILGASPLQPAPLAPLPPGPAAHRPEIAFADTMGFGDPMGSMGSMGGSQGMPGPGAQPLNLQPGDFGASPQSVETQFRPIQQPIRRGLIPTVPRIQPSYADIHMRGDMHTETARSAGRRPPFWVVAAVSCSLALLFAGICFVLLSSGSGGAPSKQRGQGATAGSNAGKGGSPIASAAPSVRPSGLAVPVAGTGGGPFSSARSAFTTALATGQQTTNSAQPDPALLGLVSAPASVPSDSAATGIAVPTTAAVPAATTAAPTATAAATATAKPTAAPTPAAPPTAAPTATAKKPPSGASMGALTVVCIPKCDQVIDNGNALGPSPIFGRPVVVGPHRLNLSTPAGSRKTIQVIVTAEESKEVRLSMDK